MKSKHTLAAIGCVLVLSACGGGGGGGGGGDAGSVSQSAPPPAPATTATVIAAANASSAAENSYEASYMVSTWSAQVPDLLNGVSITPANPGLLAPVFDLVKRAYGQDGTSLLTGVTNSYTCTNGGWIAADATQHDPRTPTVGDTWTFTANNCTAYSNVQNGAIVVKVTEASGNLFQTYSGSMTLDVVFKNFSNAKDGLTDVTDGGIKISVTRTGQTTSSFAMSGTALTDTLQKAGTVVATRTLSSFSANGSKQDSVVTASANFSLTGSSQRLGQYAYTVKNLTPFVSTGSTVPTKGALIVTGAASSVTLVVMPEGVRLDHSDNASGTITTTTSRLWSDFFNDY
jgi:hypothetical protein